MPGKILIVEEKPFMLRLIQHHLERAGYELIKARNPTEALEAMAQEAPQLVLMDEGSHSQKIETAFTDFNLTRSAPGIPMIRMTDVPQPLAEGAGSDQGEIIFTKPFSPTRLMAEVKRLVPES